MNFDPDRFTRLVQYICYSCGDPRDLGKVKLNKILWFSDMLTFERTGEPLTGESYVKLQFGPVPRHVRDAIENLKNSGLLTVREPETQFEPVQFFASERPSLAGFSADEISLVDQIIKGICSNHTAGSISKLTHDAIYELAEMGEEIPYEAFLASELGEITENDLRWAQRELSLAGTH
jgi:hypothetical protein